ncbi:hypothetical protein FRC05_010142 [Tulasnella sp. 425]|nr:hypothetical protein FRC05_010142 [Tulasnella sp. 425]
MTKIPAFAVYSPASDPASPSASGSALPKLSSQGNLIAGATARVSVGFVLNPFTVVKARFESNHYAYRSMREAFTSIWREAGPRGFLQGFQASVLRDAPYAGLYVLFYEAIKEKTAVVLGNSLPGLQPFIYSYSGAMAGALATLSTHPFDVMKTRMQVQSKDAQYRSLSRTVAGIFKERGLIGFFDGASIRIGRKVFSSAITRPLLNALDDDKNAIYYAKIDHARRTTSARLKSSFGQAARTDFLFDEGSSIWVELVTHFHGGGADAQGVCGTWVHVVKRFAVDVVGPKVREMDENETMDPEIIKGLFEQGLMGIETSADHGGAESSFTAAVIAIEELAKIDPSVSVMCDVHNTLVNTIFRTYATKEQQDKYLPLLASSKVGSFCLSEPASGSDAFALQTRAEKKGDHWVLNGSKMWITNSKEAEIFLVFATVDPSKGYKGITCFVVEKDMGIEIAKKEQKLGIRASSTCTLNFDDVKVPLENVIGGEEMVGKGYKIAIEILNEGRIGIAGQMIGLAQGAFDKAVPYTYQRKQFGKAIGEFQGMAFQMAHIATEIEAARLLTYNAARLKEEGKPFTKEAAMAKYYASVVAQKAAGSAIEWAGGVGFTRETGIEKFWRDSKIGAIYEGTSNIQLNTIAKFLQKEYS